MTTTAAIDEWTAAADQACRTVEPILHNAAHQPYKPPCQHTGGKTLLKRNYDLREVGGIKQSVPMGSKWRCFQCGRPFTTENE